MISENCNFKNQNKKRSNFYIKDNEIVDIYKLPPYESWIYDHLKRHEDEDNCAWISQKTLVSEYRISINTIRKALNNLQDIPLIEYVRTRQKGQKVYRLLPVTKIIKNKSKKNYQSTENPGKIKAGFFLQNTLTNAGDLSEIPGGSLREQGGSSQRSGGDLWESPRKTIEKDYIKKTIEEDRDSSDPHVFHKPDINTSQLSFKSPSLSKINNKSLTMSKLNIESLISEYGKDEYEEAIKIASRKNKSNNLHYISAILNNRKNEGKSIKINKSNTTVSDKVDYRVDNESEKSREPEKDCKTYNENIYDQIETDLKAMEIWDKVKLKIKENTREMFFDMFFQDIKAIKQNEKSIILISRDIQIVNHLIYRYKPDIDKIFKDLTGNKIKTQILSPEDALKLIKKKSKINKKADKKMNKSEIVENNVPIPGDVTLDFISLDPETQSRVKLDKSVIDEYTESFADGVKFPPVILYFCEDSKIYYIADGWHRVLAAKKAVLKSIKADIFKRKNAKREAILHSFRANATHGLRRTNADKRKAVETLLKDKEWSQLSNREIARKSAVGEALVRNMRKNLTAFKTQSNLRKGADGRIIDTSNIGSNRQNEKGLKDQKSKTFKTEKKLSEDKLQKENKKRKVKRGDKTYEMNTSNIGSNRQNENEFQNNLSLNSCQSELLNGENGSIKSQPSEKSQDDQVIQNTPSNDAILKTLHQDYILILKLIEFFERWRKICEANASCRVKKALHYNLDAISELANELKSCMPSNLVDYPKCSGP